nr:MAG TPA: hypothetical protein [Caudoviricetes sp.]
MIKSPFAREYFLSSPSVKQMVRPAFSRLASSSI